MARTGFFVTHAGDPFDFGRIAANHATGEVWPTGGRPIVALVAD